MKRNLRWKPKSNIIQRINLQKALSVLEKFPKPVKNRLVEFAFGRYTRYFRTNKLKVKVIDSNQVTLALANSDNQIQAIRCDAKGNIEIHVTVVVEACATPITGTMTMAWFPNSSGNGKFYLYMLFNLCSPRI